MGVPEINEGDQVYTCSRSLIRFARISLVFLGVLTLIFVIALTVQVVNPTTPAPPNAVSRLSLMGIGLFIVALNVGIYFLCERVLLRPRLVVSESGLTVINYTGSSALGWEQIAGFHVGNAYWGISIDLRDGTVVKVNAVQKSNLMSWLHRPARADRVVAELIQEWSQRQDLSDRL